MALCSPEQILYVLSHNPCGIKAQGIADILNQSIGEETYTKKKVNSVLYRMKGNLCRVDSNMKWYILFKNTCSPTELTPDCCPNDLFEYAVKRTATLQNTKDIEILLPKTSHPWANLCFSINDSYIYKYRFTLMDIVKRYYQPYFIKMYKKAYDFTFDVERIHRHFKEFFYDYKEERLIDKARRVVECEKELVQDPQNLERYSVKKIDVINDNNGIYLLTLKQLEEEEEPNLHEGDFLQLFISNQKYDCLCLCYETNQRGDYLYVSSKREIPQKGYNKYILTDSSFILDKLCDSLNDDIYEFSFGLTYEKFLHFNLKNAKIIIERPNRIKYFNEIADLLIGNQKTAFYSAIQNDISFIWGPPGTGKSRSIAGLIRAFHHLGEKTLVCCISNVAVDEIVKKVIKDIKTYDSTPESGEYCRAGWTIDAEIVKEKYLYPEDDETSSLREYLNQCKCRLVFLLKEGAEQSSKEILDLKVEIFNTSTKLKEKTDSIIDNSTILFSTVANAIVSTHLKDLSFDNIIIDEVSMVSIPYFLAIAKQAKKRIVLVGDPKQLGPISLMPHKLLRTNIFDYFNVLQDKLPSLTKLLQQFRSQPEIVDLINAPFYNNELLASKKRKVPEVDCIFPNIVVKIISDIKNNEVKYYGTTRRNFESLNYVMTILRNYFSFYKKTVFNFSIGIITPYRGQVKLYTEALAKEARISEQKEFWENIKIGTIHKFQGSECNVIIIDLVEDGDKKVGRLFEYEDGEHLLNVALSRAKDKLIIVGATHWSEDINKFSISNKVRLVLNSIHNN